MLNHTAGNTIKLPTLSHFYKSLQAPAHTVSETNYWITQQAIHEIRLSPPISLPLASLNHNHYSTN
jgi:hypothetical protein